MFYLLNEEFEPVHSMIYGACELILQDHKDHNLYNYLKIARALKMKLSQPREEPPCCCRVESSSSAAGEEKVSQLPINDILQCAEGLEISAFTAFRFVIFY